MGNGLTLGSLLFVPRLQRVGLAHIRLTHLVTRKPLMPPPQPATSTTPPITDAEITLQQTTTDVSPLDSIIPQILHDTDALDKDTDALS